MRTLRKNRQTMYYSLYLGQEREIELDDFGNPIIEKVKPDGTIVYRRNGSPIAKYSVPIKFTACIDSNLSEAHAKEYGLDQTSIYSEIMCLKNEYPITFGAKIWKKSQVGWKDEEHTIVDPNTADYTVTGVLDEHLNYDWFLLQRNNKEVSNV